MPFEEYLGYYQQTILHLFIRERENEGLPITFKNSITIQWTYLLWKNFLNTQFV